jgi:hypothetical protein
MPFTFVPEKQELLIFLNPLIIKSFTSLGRNTSKHTKYPLMPPVGAKKWVSEAYVLVTFQH